MSKLRLVPAVDRRAMPNVWNLSGRGGVTGWEPREGVGGPWHLTFADDVSSLCGVCVAGIERYVKRDPHKIDKYGGERCEPCWREWRMMTAASLARQDQDFAGEAA